MPAGGLSNRAIVRIVAIVTLSVLALYLVFLLRTPLTWIVIAAFIAIAVSGPIGWLERRIGRRAPAVALVYVAVILAPILVIGVLVPPIVTEANRFADRLPEYIADLRQFVTENEQLRKLEQDYDITARLQEEAAKLPAKLGGAAGVLGDIGLGLVNSLFAGITILILSIFMVGSGRHWIDGAIRRRPENQQPMMRRSAERIGTAVGGYCAGALLQALVAGVTAWIVLSILGVPYAPALALVVALLDLVPLVGATLGAIAVGLVTLFSDFPVDTLIWAAWSVAYQQIENTVIQPRIQSRAVQLQPFVVLVAVLFGSTLFGVLGALLAIPFAASMQICLREYGAYRRAVRLGAAEEASVLTAPPASPPPATA